MENEELQKQCEEYLNGWKRAKADLMNLQREHERDRKEWAEYATAKTLQRLLPAIDALAAAAVHAPELGDTARKFADFLREEGVTEISAEGKYDPANHEVIAREKKEGVEADTVTTVAQKGYRLHDRVLRPAKVIIAE